MLYVSPEIEFKTSNNSKIFNKKKQFPENNERVKWRIPAVADAPNPVLVVIVSNAVIFEDISITPDDELHLIFGPALPKISSDGLDIVVTLKSHNGMSHELLNTNIQSDTAWQELWLSIPPDFNDKVDICIECESGPKKDGHADWLGLAEIFVGTRKQYSLARARKNKELRSKNELAHFSKAYRMPMYTNKAKKNAYTHAQGIIQKKSIRNPIIFHQHARQLCSQKKLNVLTVCCGAARIEESLFKEAKIKPNLTLVDINQDLIEMAAERLQDTADISTICGDANEISLPKNTFDVAICVAGLHHIVELEFLLKEISGSLRENGQFWSIGEYVGRNGARLWAESYNLANEWFVQLPEKYRINNVVVGEEKPVDNAMRNVDCSQATFEGIRAEEVENVINEFFECVQINHWSTIAWRVIGPAYVDNYDIEIPEDRRLVEEIARLDAEYFVSGRLPPVGMRGIFKPRT